MNYTNNYHLPQWEKADRVLMEDFNRMCRDMEGGLIENKAEANAHLQELDTTTLRLAYNHYCTVSAMDPMPVQAGVFCRDVDKEEIPGTIGRDGARFMTLSSEDISAGDFLKTFTTISELTVVQNNLDACTPFICEFFAPRAGILESLTPGGSVNNISTPTIKIRYTLKDKETGITEWSATKEYKVSSIFGPVGAFPVNAPFCVGRVHQLMIEFVEPSGTGKVTFNPTGSYSKATFFDNCPGCSVGQSLEDVEESHGGIAVVHYKSNGAGGDMTLSWNGERLLPAVIRELPDDGPVPMREAVFQKMGHLPRKNDLTLTLQCRDLGELWFYDWGAMLI